MSWEKVNDVYGERVIRFAVPGGWLYQVELQNWTASGHYQPETSSHTGWHPPVFVPDVKP